MNFIFNILINSKILNNSTDLCEYNNMLKLFINNKIPYNNILQHYLSKSFIPGIISFTYENDINLLPIQKIIFNDNKKIKIFKNKKCRIGPISNMEKGYDYINTFFHIKDKFTEYYSLLQSINPLVDDISMFNNIYD